MKNTYIFFNSTKKRLPCESLNPSLQFLPLFHPRLFSLVFVLWILRRRLYNIFLYFHFLFPYLLYCLYKVRRRILRLLLVFLFQKFSDIPRKDYICSAFFWDFVKGSCIFKFLFHSNNIFPSFIIIFPSTYISGYIPTRSK